MKTNVNEDLYGLCMTTKILRNKNGLWIFTEIPLIIERLVSFVNNIFSVFLKKTVRNRWWHSKNKKLQKLTWKRYFSLLTYLRKKYHRQRFLHKQKKEVNFVNNVGEEDNFIKIFRKIYDINFSLIFKTDTKIKSIING